MNTTLHICGPANGSLTFSFPEFQRSSDDSFILPSSECELAAGQSVFRLNRISVSGVPALRAGAYKQVFEQGMNRFGHSFGPVFEFVGDVPNGTVLAQTMMELLAIIEQNCIHDTHFCSYERFHAFLEAEIFPSFNGIVRQLNPTHTRRIIGIPLRMGQGIQCYSDLPPGPADLVGELIDWFASDPSAILCETLLIGNKVAVGSMVRPLQFDAIASATIQHLYKATASLQIALTEASTSLKEAQSTLSIMQKDCRSLTSDLNLAQHEARSAARRAELLEAKVRTLEADFPRGAGKPAATVPHTAAAGGSPTAAAAPLSPSPPPFCTASLSPSPPPHYHGTHAYGQNSQGVIQTRQNETEWRNAAGPQSRDRDVWAGERSRSDGRDGWTEKSDTGRSRSSRSRSANWGRGLFFRFLLVAVAVSIAAAVWTLVYPMIKPSPVLREPAVHIAPDRP